MINTRMLTVNVQTYPENMFLTKHSEPRCWASGTWAIVAGSSPLPNGASTPTKVRACLPYCGACVPLGVRALYRVRACSSRVRALSCVCVLLCSLLFPGYLDGAESYWCHGGCGPNGPVDWWDSSGRANASLPLNPVSTRPATTAPMPALSPSTPPL